MSENVPRDPNANPDDAVPPALKPDLGEWREENATVSDAAEAIAQAEDRLLRLAAEYDNYRKRTNREKGRGVRPGRQCAGDPVARRARRHGPSFCE